MCGTWTGFRDSVGSIWDSTRSAVIGKQTDQGAKDREARAAAQAAIDAANAKSTQDTNTAMARRNRRMQQSSLLATYMGGTPGKTTLGQ